MPTVTTAIKHVRNDPEAPLSRIGDHWHCLVLAYGPAQIAYIPSHDGIEAYLPPNATVLSARVSERGIPAITKNGAFRTGRAELSGATFEILDYDNGLTDFINLNFDSARGLFNSTLTHYTWPAETRMPIPAPRSTWQVTNHDTSDEGTVRVVCKDINRNTDVEVFDPIIWRLRSALTQDADEIQTTMLYTVAASLDIFFEHGEHYGDHPGETGAYARIKDEVFWFTGWRSDNGYATMTGVDRALFNTSRATVDIDNTTDESNREKITEWIVIRETATDLVRGVLTRKLADGRTFPYGIGINPQYINESSFARHADPVLLEFANPGKIKAREWYETQILAPKTVLSVNNRGQLVWTPVVRPISGDTGAEVIDESNYVEGSVTLRSDTSNIAPYVAIEYDLDPFTGEYLSRIEYRNESAAAFYRTSKEVTYQYPGLKTGIHTAAEVQRIAGVLGQTHFYEVLRCQVKTFLVGIEVGQSVYVSLPVADHTTGADLARSFVVTAVSEDFEKGTAQYTLEAALLMPSTVALTELTQVVSDEEITRLSDTMIQDLPGISINSGVATGSITLENGKLYGYIGGDLEFGAGLSVTITGRAGRVGILTNGSFITKSDLNLTGLSPHVPGTGENSTKGAKHGGVGAIGTSRGGGGVKATKIYRNTGDFDSDDYYVLTGLQVDENIRPLQNPPAPSSVQDVALKVNNDQLSGIPSDLSGSSGPGGRAVEIYDPDPRPQGSAADGTPSNPHTDWADGGDGSYGGGGLFILSAGGGVQDGAQVILDGAPLAANTNKVTIGTFEVQAWEGGPGMHGGIVWAMNGNHPAPILTSANISAKPGAYTITGQALRDGQNLRVGQHTGTYRGRYGPTAITNRWQDAAIIVGVPPSQNVEPLPSTSIDAAFANQADNRIRWHEVPDYGTSWPSYADFGDIAFTTEVINSKESRPLAYILRSNSQWTPVNWDADSTLYSLLLLDARGGGGGNTIHNTPTRPVVFDEGDLWRDPQSKIIWELHADGDEVFSRGELVLGDERLGDPNFAITASGDPRWYVSDNPDELPIIPIAGSGILVRPTLDIDYVDGGYEFVDNSLPEPVGVTVTIIDHDSAELFWQSPGDPQITGYEVTLDGVSQGVVSALSYPFDNNLSDETQYEFGVRSVDGDGNYSDLVVVFATTDAIGGAVDLNPPTGLTITYSDGQTGSLSWTAPVDDTGVVGYAVYRNGQYLATSGVTSYYMNDHQPSTSYTYQVRSSDGAGEYSDAVTVSGTTPSDQGSTDPTIDVTQNGDGTIGPVISGTTTNVEENRDVYVNLGPGFTGKVQANGTWSVTVTSPATYDGQLCNPYVSNAAGIGATDPDGEFEYTS